MASKIRLGVNIDHVATLRNARKENFPNLMKVAEILSRLSVDLITVHLREDRRHIMDKDVFDLKKKNFLPLNLEMAATEEMKEICTKLEPDFCCIVPEKRAELTTEGGLNVKGKSKYLVDFVRSIKSKNIFLSLFVDPDIEQIQAAKDIGADAVELHTGKYSRLFKTLSFNEELNRIKNASIFCSQIGLTCHAGHGLDFDNVKNISSIENIKELNVGHFLVSQAIFDGLEKTIIKFREIIDDSRH